MLYVILLFQVFITCASDSPTSSSIESENKKEVTIEMEPISEASMSTPTRDICDEMIYYYFKGNGEKIRDQIKPYLQRRIQSPWKKQKLSSIQSIDLKRSSTIVDPEVEKYINKKVSQAMEEAFEEERRERIHFEAEARERCSKNQVAAITAITGVITAAIAAGVTLAITFGT